jgi:hypothetical protein
MEHPSSRIPRAFAALDAFPALRASVAVSLERQAARVVATLTRFQEQPELFAALDQAINPPGGMIALVGAPGTGVTSTLAALAVRFPAPLWLSADDAEMGARTLYAQILALHRPGVPLVDPAAATDPLALERLLNDAAAARSHTQPIVLLVDAPEPGQRPLPLPLPADLPPGVTLIYGCSPVDQLPYPARHIINLADFAATPELYRQALQTLGCPAAHTEALIAAAQGNWLFLELAATFLLADTLDPAQLPDGLEGLLNSWWAQIGAAEHRLAELLAAAGEPLPLPLIGELLAADPAPILAHWETLGFVDLILQTTPGADRSQLTLRAAFSHSAPRRWINATQPAGVQQAHTSLAELGFARRTERTPMQLATTHYLLRQTARHAAHSAEPLPTHTLPQLINRAWIGDHERRMSLEAAYNDVAWELQTAAQANTDLGRTVLAAALAGTLATRARTLSPAATVEALTVGLERSGREAALKRVLDVVERLPDGNEKAQILRQLGEACYEARMRQSAMRLLSRALDLEANPTSRAWRDQREQLLAALAGTAINHDAIDDALAIAERIEHLERRAVVETQAARKLLAEGDRDRAQRVARNILHESMGAWARAEVAVALLRTGDQRGALMLDEIDNETAFVWAQIELACDAAPHDPAAARRRIDGLRNPNQRDRGLTRLALALAEAGSEAAALRTAQDIQAADVRLTALIDLRQVIGGAALLSALNQAAANLDALSPDDRAPLLAALAAAFAALGQTGLALSLVRELPEGEERDRARARTAVALTRRGDYSAALHALDLLTDEDERDWARDEIVRLLAADGLWDEALTLINTIAAPEQRARTNADLAIERGRAGEAQAALALALAVDEPDERARALTVLAPILVATEAPALAQAVITHPEALADSEARNRYLAALATAFAAHGDLAAAQAISGRIRRPIERARAELACAHALAVHNPPAAQRALNTALCTTAIGREEILRTIEWSAPLLAELGGTALIRRVAEGLLTIDS